MSELEFKTDDVEIAEDGRVVIKNPAFAKALVAHVKTLSPETAAIFDNCDCKRGALSAVPLSKVIPSATLKLEPGTVGIFDNCDCKR